MAFSRTANIEYLLEKLKKEPLYNEKLKNDNDVFMGLRDNEIHFYYGGSRIYKYTNKGFMSHKEYCINTNETVDYVNQNELCLVNIITDKLLNYEPIKKMAKKYAGLEDKGISKLFKNDYNVTNNVFLLDIEIALKSGRIDILLFDNKNKILKFIEAKHYSNKELWSEEGSKPLVIDQINKYNNDLCNDDYNNEILCEYKKYIKILNGFLNLDTPINLPQKIESATSLYVFGFDQNQKIKIEKLLKKDDSLDDIEYYFIGNESTVNIENIFKGNKDKR